MQALGRRTTAMTFGALALVGAAGCAAGEAPETSSGAPSPAADPAYCQELDGDVHELVDDLAATGAVVLVQSPELGDCFLSYGVRALGEDEPIALDDQFRIGSNTKTMTGTVVLQLVDEGLLRLDDPVSKYRADVPNGENITIDQLLAMRSGLADYSAAHDLSVAMDETPERVWSADEVLALSYAEPPAFAPGDGHLYSNANTVLLGLIVEDLTGMPMEPALEERIFAPLGLDSTLLPERASNTLPQSHARGYMFGSVVDLVAGGGVLPAAEAADAKAGTLVPNDVTDMNPSWGWAAGAGVSTTEELARYAKALGTGELLSDDTHQQRLASVIPTDPDNPASAAYGQAIVKYGALYGHTGELPGYNSFMAHDPERDITVIAWANLMAAPDGRLTADALAQAVIDVLYPAP
jgi:D-alanyl-D-alanine carboxypeptidase